MKIKKKLFLGFGVLFVVVMIFGGVSLYYIKTLSNVSNSSIKNNYETLTYTREMRAVLDEHSLPLSPAEAKAFDESLKKQENNITEPGEREATAALRQSFTLLAGPAPGIKQKLRADSAAHVQLKQIEGLNMRAIIVKGDHINATVSTSTVYLGGMALITFFILFILIANFPGFILIPLAQITEAMQEVDRKYYDTRLEFTASEEFVQLSDAFNKMVAGLSREQNASLTKIITADLRAKTLAEEMQDAVIAIDEKGEVVFINAPAINLFGLGTEMVISQPVKHLIPGHPMLKAILENKDTDTPLKLTHNGKQVYYKQKNLEISAPNLHFDSDNTVQYASHAAGIIYILKHVAKVDVDVPAGSP